MVRDSERGTDDRRVAAVTTSQFKPDQLETLLRRLLAGPAVTAPPPKPERPTVEQLLQCLLAGTQVRKPTPGVATGSSDIETLLQSLLLGNLAPATRPRSSTMQRDWTTVVCFLCGKAGHSATRCPDLNETVPFMLLGWKAEKVGGGYVIISPRVAVKRRRAGNDDCSRKGGSAPGSVVELDPRVRGW